MEQNAVPRVEETNAPPMTDKAIPGEAPTVDGKQPPGTRDNVIPFHGPAPEKQPEKQGPAPPVDRPQPPEPPKQDQEKPPPEPKKPDQGKAPSEPKKSTEHKKPAKPKKEADAGSKKPPAQKEQTQPEPAPPPPEPVAAPRSGEKEQIVYLKLSDLHPFKDHPFQVRKDDEMQAMVSSVKDKGVTQPAVVRPREGGGYEMVSGHRRQKASELAGFFEMPCIVRNLTDEEAITQMVEDNTNQREQILPSERAKALKMQLDAIKRQGARTDPSKDENEKRSNAVVAERNKMSVKTVQRYIKLNELVPDLAAMVDEKKIGFTTAVELAFIKPKSQRYIAVAIEGQGSAPSFSQAQRMRELSQKNMLQPDMIDGIMLEQKKEADKVIISSQELEKYFGKDKTPRQMKDTILKLLDEYAAKKPPELNKPAPAQDRGK
jgi:ParB/RepB/Spo0J family partition protein